MSGLFRKVWVPVTRGTNGRPELDLVNIDLKKRDAAANSEGPPVRATVVVRAEDWNKIKTRWRKNN